jgi:hypothetical protein
MMFCLGGGTGKEDLLQIFEISDFKNMLNCTNNKKFHTDQQFLYVSQKSRTFANNLSLT